MISRRRWLGIAGLAATSLLVHPAVALAQRRHTQIRQHATSKQGFYANSYLIEGAESCVLVDAHLNTAEAQDLAGVVKRLGKPLEAIIITHPHPDHYLGLRHLMPLWPRVAIRAAPLTLDIIRTASTDWGRAANPLIALEQGRVMLAGRAFDCLLPPDAESVAPVVVYEAETKTLIAGDHILSGQHLWLAEGRWDAWRRNLQDISRNRSIETVLPGHGAVGGMELCAETDGYLRDFMDLKARGLGAAAMRREMLMRYPSYVFTEALESSIRAHI